MSWRWQVELTRPDGTLAAVVPFEPDWEPASIWVRFEGMRRGLLPPVLSSVVGEVEPCWTEATAGPYVEALRIAVRGDGDTSVVERIPAAYLTRQIRALVPRLVASGVIAEGEVLTPRVTAALVSDPAANEDRDRRRLRVTEIPRTLPLIETPIGWFLNDATPYDVGEGDPDVPVFVPERVLREVEACAAAAGGVETGGFLLGHLHRDPARPEIFVEVTAQVPAAHAIAERLRFTFTPDTWAAVEDVCRARGCDESIVSWWHYHPPWCASCPPERRKTCALDTMTFSADDVSLHHLFAQAHQTALLVSAKEHGLVHSFFGWRAGSVAARGYYVTH